MADIERIRGRRLQRIRMAHLNQHPLCVMCLAKQPQRLTPATQIDHIVALVNGGQDVESNRQGLCDECHEDKTAEDMGYQKRVKFDQSGRVVW